MLTWSARGGILRDVTRATEHFEQLVTAWTATHSSPSTRAAYGGDLASFSRWCTQQAAIPLRVTADDVAAYQLACTAAGASSATVRRRASSLASFFRYALERGAVETNPTAGTDRPAVDRPGSSATPLYDGDDVERLLSIAAGTDPRLHALVGLLACDGLKLQEALELDAGDIAGRAPRTTATLRRRGHERIVLDRRTGVAVRRCIAGRAAGPVLTSARAAAPAAPPARLTRFGADHLLKQLPPTCGAPVTANALRRAFVTSSHRAGVDLDEIRARAGLDDVRSAARHLPPGTPPRTDTHPPAGRGSGRRGDQKEA